MMFLEANLIGAFMVGPGTFQEERGWPASTFCATEFAEQSVKPEPVEVINERDRTCYDFIHV